MKPDLKILADCLKKAQEIQAIVSPLVKELYDLVEDAKEEDK